jgi:hypothetical protein
MTASQIFLRLIKSPGYCGQIMGAILLLIVAAGVSHWLLIPAFPIFGVIVNVTIGKIKRG